MKINTSIKSLLLLCLIPFFSCKNLPSTGEANQAIQSVKESFVPDKRVAIFGVEAQAVPNGIVLRGETNLPEAKKELFEKLSLSEIELIDSIKVLPGKELGDKIYGIVNLSACNNTTKKQLEVLVSIA